MAWKDAKGKWQGSPAYLGGSGRPDAFRRPSVPRARKTRTAYQPMHVDSDKPMPVDYRTGQAKRLTAEEIRAAYPGASISYFRRPDARQKRAFKRW